MTLRERIILGVALLVRVNVLGFWGLTAPTPIIQMNTKYPNGPVQ
jgi:hypothetical protein